MVRSLTERIRWKDEPGDFERCRIANPHVDGTLMAHLVSEKNRMGDGLVLADPRQGPSEMFVCGVNNQASRRRASRLSRRRRAYLTRGSDDGCKVAPPRETDAFCWAAAHLTAFGKHIPNSAVHGLASRLSSFTCSA
jgi:hypothetical protein